jgi:hypothetical protein
VSPIIIALYTFAFIFGGSLVGLILRKLLPDHHLIDDSRDVVKLGAGLIATLAALVLGLLISSGKNSLDTMNAEMTQMGTQIIELDHNLASYGPETGEIREQLRTSVNVVLEKFYPVKSAGQGHDSIKPGGSIERMQDRIRALSPANDSQRQLQSHAQKSLSEISHARWLMIEQTESPLPIAFLIILIFWLAMLFVSFGMLAPHNGTVVAVLFVCALSVSAAIFLILEMNTPITGIINVSGAPLRNALVQMGK